MTKAFQTDLEGTSFSAHLGANVGIPEIFKVNAGLSGGNHREEENECALDNNKMIKEAVFKKAILVCKTSFRHAYNKTASQTPIKCLLDYTLLIELIVFFC